jgi:hypothetical protein
MSSRENSVNPLRRRSFDGDLFEADVPELVHSSSSSTPRSHRIQLSESDSEDTRSPIPNGLVHASDGPIRACDGPRPSSVRIENVVFGSGGVVSVSGLAQAQGGPSQSSSHDRAETLHTLNDRLRCLLGVAAVEGVPRRDRRSSSRPRAPVYPVIEFGQSPPLSSIWTHQPSMDAYMTSRESLTYYLPFPVRAFNSPTYPIRLFLFVVSPLQRGTALWTASAVSGAKCASSFLAMGLGATSWPNTLS